MEMLVIIFLGLPCLKDSFCEHIYRNGRIEERYNQTHIIVFALRRKHDAITTSSTMKAK